MKPDWKDAPEWANWLAMDNDGYWMWYENEPYWRGYLGEWDRRTHTEKYAIAQRPPEQRFEGEDTKEPRP